MKYKYRTNGASCTVFVPYDCHNNCPFCINKREYADGLSKGFSTEKIIESIKKVSDITPRCDFIFTGGEPMANLEELQKMLDAIPSSHKIFINSTLPVNDIVSIDDIVNFTDKNKDKITGYNVSRHLKKFVVECDDSIFARLSVPIRVNCVLFGGVNQTEITNFIDRFDPYNLDIQFRQDYMRTTAENLYAYDENMAILDNLSALSKISKWKMTGCRMRNGQFYKTHNGRVISYHKTLPYSQIKEPDGKEIYNVLYDIIIKQTGRIDADWDMSPLVLSDYKNAVSEDEPNRGFEYIWKFGVDRYEVYK